MKKLQLYILTAVFKAFIPAFVALVLLMAGGICMQLLHEGLDVVRLSGLLWLALAYCVPMVLPSAFLTAVIMAFGRLTADNELTAVRAAGIHLFRATHPVLWAACGLALVAAYFQFEAVPRARGALKALKYEAFKQILLDSAALSWRRSFSFPPIFIQYEDYRGGRMHDVLVMQVEGRRPSIVITAKSAVIRADERNEEQITFEMDDCKVTHFDVREDGMPLAGASTQAVYSIKAAPRSEDVLSRRRYMPLFDLIREGRALARSVQSQPELVEGQPEFRDPKAVRKEREAERRRIQVAIAGVEKSISTMTGDYDRYTIEEPRRNNQIVEANTRAIVEAQKVLNELEEQLADCTRQLDEIENTGAGRERQETLLGRQSTIFARIEANKREAKTMQAELEEAHRALQTAAVKAARLEEPLDVLRERRGELRAQHAEASRLVRQARDQEDLREMRVRVHKRLAQALSVLTFALVGIPLGIAASRRSVMIAFGLSFAVVLLVFQPMLIYGAQAAEVGALPIVPAVWAGNALTFAIGVALTVRVLSR